MGSKLTQKSNAYNKKNYEQVRLIVKKGKKNEIKELAEDHDKSINGLLNEMIERELEMSKTDLTTIYNERTLTTMGEVYYLLCKLCNRDELYLYAEAQIFPYKIITLLHHRMNNRWSSAEGQVISEKMCNLSELLTGSDASDVINVLMNTPVPMDLRGYFIKGLYNQKGE